MPFRSDDLRCPDCHAAMKCNLKDSQETLECPARHGPWPAENGIARFAEGEVCMLTAGGITGSIRMILQVCFV